TPYQVRLSLGKGQRQTVPYALGLPGNRKVDVYFLVDTTRSMTDKIAALRPALGRIVNALVAAHLDPWFGLGEFRSYDQGPAYERLVDISPPGRQLQNEIDGLKAAGGGDETQLDGLYQAA